HRANDNDQEAGASCAASPDPKRAVRLHDEPSRAQQRVSEHQCQPCQDRERRQEDERAPRELPSLDAKSLNERAEHQALRECPHERAIVKGTAPECPASWILNAKLEADPPKSESDQQDEYRDMHGRQKEATV